MNNKDTREAVRDLMGMSQEQRNYAAAKAFYQTIKERVDKEKATVVHGDLSTPEGWEPYDRDRGEVRLLESRGQPAAMPKRRWSHGLRTFSNSDPLRHTRK